VGGIIPVLIDQGSERGGTRLARGRTSFETKVRVRRPVDDQVIAYSARGGSATVHRAMVRTRSSRSAQAAHPNVPADGPQPVAGLLRRARGTVNASSKVIPPTSATPGDRHRRPDARSTSSIEPQKSGAHAPRIAPDGL